MKISSLGNRSMILWETSLLNFGGFYRGHFLYSEDILFHMWICSRQIEHRLSSAVKPYLNALPTIHFLCGLLYLRTFSRVILAVNVTSLCHRALYLPSRLILIWNIPEISFLHIIVNVLLCDFSLISNSHGWAILSYPLASLVYRANHDIRIAIAILIPAIAWLCVTFCVDSVRNIF